MTYSYILFNVLFPVRSDGNNRINPSLLLSCLFLLQLNTLRTQAPSGSSASIPDIRENIDNLIQGRFYDPIYPYINGSQYLSRNWILGEIEYLDKAYKNLPILYDIYIDQILLVDLSNQGPNIVRLNKDYIRSFSLSDRHFINYNYSHYKNSGLAQGYYEVLFEDQVQLLAKRNNNRTIKNSINHFLRKDSWYLIRDGKAFKIHNKKSFYAAAGQDIKSELSKILKKERVRWRSAGDAEWMKLVTDLNGLLTK